MSYIRDFTARIKESDYPGFLRIWEEYCYMDEPDAPELIEILELIKDSELAHPFGMHVERCLPLWNKLQAPEDIHKILRLIIDLEKTNSIELGEISYQFLKQNYESDPYFAEKIRLVGLRNRQDFQGAISNFELLTHMGKGKFVFHKGGWGTGEVLDVSFLREEASFEFDFVVGQKFLSFGNAFKNLIPLSDDHFLSRRFGNPDLLEKQAKENPCEILQVLLRDLGPKTAMEIKEELYELVIGEKEWNRWWQAARSKLKKDTRIETPKDMKQPFRYLEKEVSHEASLYKSLEAKPGLDETIHLVYTFLRDFPETVRKSEFKSSLEEKLLTLLKEESLAESQKIQLCFLLEDLSSKKRELSSKELIAATKDLKKLVYDIEIFAFKKRVLTSVKKSSKEWESTFFDLLFAVDQNYLRDYLLTELSAPNLVDKLKEKLAELIKDPIIYPEMFFWYFQKVFQKNSSFPFSDKKGKTELFESFLILLGQLSGRPLFRDLGKKMAQLLIDERYLLVRDMFKHASLAEVKEFLLLATKSEYLSDHDIKIMNSLAEVVFPSLFQSEETEEVIWTTAEGYAKVHKRMEQIATQETVQNAKEIEAARALGDLRENAEFKSALEKRDRLQAELKLLSEQANKARVLTKEDISTDEVGIGVKVECQDSKGKKAEYTLLGPWDADPEKNILSFHSKFAQAMVGCKEGKTFTFQGENYTVLHITNALIA